MSSKKIYGHVAVIGVDGMGAFNKKTETPRMDEIFAVGAVTYSALSMDPTISAENWAAMLLGASPMVHGLTNSIIGSHEYHNDRLPSVFRRIRRKMPQAFLASYCNWDPINYGIVEHDCAVEMAAGRDDEEVADKVVKVVKKKPVFLFVQFDNVDGAGHHYGFGTGDYLAEVRQADARVGRVFDAYSEAGILGDTLFVVTADHGGIRNGHGGYTDPEKYIFLGVRGDGIMKSEIPFAQTRDIAAIVLRALGLDVPEYDENGFSSQLPAGIFEGEGDTYRTACPVSRERESLPTPAIDGRDGLYSFFPREREKLAMFMDNDLTDAAGKCRIREEGHVKFYSRGVYGSRAEFGSTGHAVVDGIDFRGSFTAALWLRIDRSITEAPALLANKDWWWQHRDGQGFCLALRCNDTVFNIGCGDSCAEVYTPFPDSVRDGWLHCITAVDKEKGEIRVYYDFAPAHRFALDKKFCGSSDSTLPFVVGNDGLGIYNSDKKTYDGVLHDFIFNLDDLLIFDGAFGDEEAARLGKYYGE